MNEQLSTKKTNGSVARRFNITLVLLYLLGIVISIPSIYFYTRHETYSQANTDLQLLVDFVESIKGYVAKDLRPFFLKEGIFHAPAVSGIVATASIAHNLKERQESYSIRSVSDNPLNPANLPEPLERELLERFRTDPSQTELKMEGILGKQRMLVASTPMVAKKGCSKCHGDPKNAPGPITEQYGSSSGYNYRTGDIVGLSLVGVPMEDLDSITFKRSGVAIGVLTLLFAVMFITINAMIRRQLITPVLQITALAHAVVKGDFDQTLTIKRDDEIGELARSVELMRRSFAQIIKRMKKN